MKQSLYVIGVFVLACSAGSAGAQCANSAQPSCAVYDACFAKFCPCQGDPAEYFISYGKKYCTSFLGHAGFSAAGNQWRDAALVCLQERIVPHLPLSTASACDCSAMRGTAFDAHVACYTQAGASICDLPAADLKEIWRIIDMADLFTSEGWRQMRDVAAICSSSAPDDGRRALWKKAHGVLQLR